LISPDCRPAHHRRFELCCSSAWIRTYQFLLNFADELRRRVSPV